AWNRRSRPVVRSGACASARCPPRPWNPPRSACARWVSASRASCASRLVLSFRVIRPEFVVLKKAPAFAAVLVATASLAFAFAHAPQPATPQPATPQPAALSDALPVPPAPKPSTSAAWLLMDYTTGQILAGENIDMRREPASITKVMTSYVIAAEMAAGKIKADDPVMMTENAWRQGGAGTDGSYSGFPVNQTAPLVQMEKGMVVQSGNDAAIALAEHVAGSEQAFAALMNAYAKR